MDSTRLHHILWLPLFAYLLWFFNDFAWFDGLTSIANDSVNYLVMARHYSPWFDETPAIASAWRYEDFPIFFPLVLALTGASHSIYWAHVLVSLFSLASLPLLYLFARKKLKSGVYAILVVLITGLSAGYIFAAQGILSESLYFFLSLLILMQINRKDGRYHAVLTGVLLALLLLTRTIGMAMALALAMTLLIDYIRDKRLSVNKVTALIIACIVYACFKLTLGPETTSHYYDVLRVGVAGDKDIAALFTNNLLGLMDAWRTYWLIYWHDGTWLLQSLVLALGALFIVAPAIVIYFRSDNVVAWYALIYLSVIVVWPHPGQMVRLLMPVIPVLLVVSVQAVLVLVDRRNPGAVTNKAITVALVSFLLVILPAQGFVNNRVAFAQDNDMPPMYDLFRIVNAVEAKDEVYIQAEMLRQFSTLKQHINADESVLYYTPAYPALLSDVRVEKLQVTDDIEVLSNNIIQSDAKYLLLTYYHPRMKRQGVSGDFSAALPEKILSNPRCHFSNEKMIGCLYEIQR